MAWRVKQDGAAWRNSVAATNSVLRRLAATRGIGARGRACARHCSAEDGIIAASPSPFLDARPHLTLKCISNNNMAINCASSTHPRNADSCQTDYENTLYFRGTYYGRTFRRCRCTRLPLPARRSEGGGLLYPGHRCGMRCGTFYLTAPFSHPTCPHQPLTSASLRLHSHHPQPGSYSGLDFSLWVNTFSWVPFGKNVLPAVTRGTPLLPLRGAFARIGLHRHLHLPPRAHRAALYSHFMVPLDLLFCQRVRCDGTAFDRHHGYPYGCTQAPARVFSSDKF